VTPDNFFAQTGITEPRRYVIYHAICGDSSDHIEGIQGVGDTTATRIANLVNFTGIVRRGDILEAVEKLKVSDKRNAKRYQLVADHLDIVARNLQLVDLNLEKLNSDEINTVMQEYQRPREFDEKEVVSYFNFYEFRSYLENFANFIQPFRTLRKVITSPA
jgi:5'-3' exonuclease